MEKRNTGREKKKENKKFPYKHKKWNKKAILWRTIWLLASILAIVIFLSWVSKRVDLLCVLGKLVEAFQLCGK